MLRALDTRARAPNSIKTAVARWTPPLTDRITADSALLTPRFNQKPASRSLRKG